MFKICTHRYYIIYSFFYFRNELEKFFLRGLGYDVSVKASHYAKTYFELRDLSNKGHEKTRIDRPLTAWNVLKFAEV
jgi:hypothetical protein